MRSYNKNFFILLLTIVFFSCGSAVDTFDISQSSLDDEISITQNETSDTNHNLTGQESVTENRESVSNDSSSLESQTNSTNQNSALFQKFPSVIAFRSSMTDNYASYADIIDVFHDSDSDLLKDVYKNSNALAISRASHLTISNTDRSKVKPCYFLYGIGGFSQSNIKDSDTEIEIDRIENFSDGMHATIFYYDSSKNKVVCNEQFEEVIITKVKTSQSKLKISRGEFETEPQKFSRSQYKIYIAPHYMTWDNVENAWALNPLKANDFFVDYILNEVLENKRGGDANGLEFDGGRFKALGGSVKAADINLDGVADFGFVNGVNVYGLYATKFYEELRKQLPDLIIQVDSSTVEKGYRSFSDINGIEMENYGDWDSFSEVFQHLKTWTEETDSRYQAFSYPVTKENTKQFYCDYRTIWKNNHFRLGLASSLLVGMPHASASENPETGTKCFDYNQWDEYVGGDLQKAHWLGKPISPAVRILDHLSQENLLENLDWSEMTKHSDYKISSSASDKELVLTVKKVATEVIDADEFYPDVSGAGLMANIKKNVSKATNGGKEFTLKFKARALNTYPSNYSWAEEKNIPRYVKVKLYGSNQNSAKHDLLITKDQKEYVLTFTFEKNVSVNRIAFLSGEETGELHISDMQLYEGSADRWVRYFENGAILVNASRENWNISLDKSYYNGSISGFQRISGKQDPNINNGEKASGPDFNEIEVPSGDALLVKTF